MASMQRNHGYKPASASVSASRNQRPSPPSIDPITSSTPCPTVLISNAEGSKHLINYPPLLPSPNGSGVLVNLSSTDCVFYGNGNPDPTPSSPARPSISIGVEVKSLHDMLTGFDDGRLFATQIPKLLAAHDVCYLVFYGIFRCSPDDHVTLQELKRHYYPSSSHSAPAPFNRWTDVKLGSRPVRYGFLVSRLDKLSRLGVIHDHAPDISYAGPESARPPIPDLTHVALWIGALARSYAKPFSEQTSSFRTFDRSRDSSPARPDLDSTTRQIARLVFSLPGIGWDRAFALAQSFPSFLDICLATPEQLAEVCTISGDGRRVRFGIKLAESIYRTIRAKR